MKKAISIFATISVLFSAMYVYARADGFFYEDGSVWEENEYEEYDEYDEYNEGETYYDGYIECPYCEKVFEESEISYHEEGHGICPFCGEQLEGYEKEKLEVYVWYEYDEENNGYDVYMSASDMNAEIYFTTNRRYPDTTSYKYEEPFYAIGKRPVIRAIAYLGEEKSEVVNVWLTPENKEDEYQEENDYDGEYEYDYEDEEYYGNEYEYNYEENDYSVKIELTIGSKIIYINGEAVEIEAPPVIRNERTMVPIRVIAEALGATVNWHESGFPWLGINGPTVSIETEGGGHEYLITIGEKSVLVWSDFTADDFDPNKAKNPTLDSPAFIENDRTYLPVRFVSEGLGAKVEWDSSTYTVTITK